MHEVRVFTRDREYGRDRQPFGFARRLFIPDGEVQVAYLKTGPQDFAWMIRSLWRWQPDLYYVNSLHGRWFALLPIFLRRVGLLPHAPLLLNPRGETSPGSQGMKPVKKRVGRPVIRALIGRRVVWHAAAQHEACDIQTWLGRNAHAARIMIQANYPPKPATVASTGSDTEEVLRVTFASRIHPTKGLLEAIGALGESRVPIHLSVYGPIEDSKYWEQCQALASHYDANIAMTYQGEYNPEQSANIFAAADLAVLLSRGESFGHAIAESLAVGCPVLISANTPWTDFVNNGGGLASNDPNDHSHFVKILSMSTNMQREAERRSVLTRYKQWYSENRPRSSIFTEALCVTSKDSPSCGRQMMQT